MTGLMTMAMSASAGLGAALAVPAEDVLGTDWRGSQAIWFVPALIAALLWLPFVAEGRRAARRVPVPPRPATALLRDRVALQVTLFMGLQSLSFYGLLSWLPEILREAGLSREASGTLLSVMLVTGIPTCLAVPVLVGRRGDQRAAMVVTVAMLTVAIVGLLVARDVAPLAWVIAAGLAQGSLLGLGFLFFGIRSRDTLGAGRLAAMAQTVGFLIAAAGPLVMGALHDATGGWTAPLVFLLVAVVPTLLTGLGAARDRVVGDAAPT
jgi:CP family cyanate transporter-like MFS transporter